MIAVEYINFLLYALFFAYLFKSNKPMLALFVAGIWTFSAFIGIFYFNSDVFRSSWHNVEIVPFFYLFVVVAILIYPLSRKKFKIDRIYANEKLIRALAIFFVIIGIFPTIEVLLYFVKSLVTGQFMVNAMMYEDVADGLANSDIERNMSFIGVKLLHIVAYFNLFMPIVVFHLFSKRRKFLSIAVFVVTMIHPIFAVCNGGRTRLVFMTLYYVSLFIVLKGIFARDLYLKIRKYMIIVATCIGLIFVGLSVGRFVLGNQYGKTALTDYLFQYTAESQYNFNNLAWHNRNPLMGDFTLWYFKEKIELRKSVNFKDRRVMLAKNTDIPTHLFYSLPGELVLDWGPTGALLIAIVIAFLFSRIRVKNGSIRMSSLLLLGAYIFLTSNSIFYYVYKVYSEFYGAALLTWILLRVSENPRFMPPKECKFCDNLIDKN